MIKAVVVGINVYRNFPNQTLAGCINDAEDVLAHLTGAMQVAPENITPLYDDRATKTEIVTALHDMVASASAGDHLLFHFSGHGAQIPADSVAEPDGLDEVLCPTDFSFGDRSSALVDDEIAELFESLPPRVALTIVVDACHSGDIMKDLKGTARFLRPPADVAWKLARKHLVTRKRVRDFVEGATVSACKSSETASDTSFNGRPNGAFTHYWLEALRATPKATLDELVAKTAKSLTTYGMHPQIDGASELRRAMFLDQSLLVPSRDLTNSSPRTIAVANRSVVLFEDRWYAGVMGVPLSLGLSITRAGSTFNFELTPSVAGAVPRFSVPVDGNASIPIPVPLVGQLIVDIGGWSLSPLLLAFDLSVRVQPSLPFVPPVTVVSQRLSIPLTVEQRAFDAPTTASEFYAMLALLRGASPAPLIAPPPPRAISASDNTPFATRSDRMDWGPNWSENRTIPVGPLPHNQIRYGEPVFFNQQGAGTVGFVGWLNDDPTDGSFTVHIGNNFFGGWGSKMWQVMAVYADIDIVVRDLPSRTAPAPEQRYRAHNNGAGSSNGHSHTGESIMLPEAAQ